MYLVLELVPLETSVLDPKARYAYALLLNIGDNLPLLNGRTVLTFPLLLLKLSRSIHYALAAPVLPHWTPFLQAYLYNLPLHQFDRSAELKLQSPAAAG